jgi:glycopeptide antibiotics resistance protein
VVRRRPVVLAIAGLYALAILLIGFWPTHVDENLDLEQRPPVTWLVALFDLAPEQAYGVGEFAANILLFMPLGIFAMLLVPGISWVRTVAGALTVTILIEVVQTLLRPDRTGSIRDVVANTLGAAIGAGIVVGVRRVGAAAGRSAAGTTS